MLKPADEFEQLSLLTTLRNGIHISFLQDNPLGKKKFITTLGHAVQLCSSHQRYFQKNKFSSDFPMANFHLLENCPLIQSLKFKYLYLNIIIEQ